jgi:hypothetical protein
VSTPTHPLASRKGIAILVNVLEADSVWRQATKRQRELLTEVCAPVIEAITNGAQPPAVKIHESGHKLTLESLRRKGFLDDDNRLTERAVHAAYWTWWMNSREDV